MSLEGIFPIPSLLNVALTCFDLVAAITLLKIASIGNGLVPVFAAIAFAYLMLTNYSLVHEAAHRKLHSNSRVNYALGLVPATLFPMSLTLLMNSHERHHTQNRGVFEQFDCFTPNDSRPLKYGVWYGILLGFFGLYPPVWSAILAVVPLPLIKRFAENTTSTKAYASTLTHKEIRRIRYEVAGIVGFFCFLVFSLGIKFGVLVLFYALALINWSTRQFVEHAYTALDNIEGAHDLKHFWWMSFMMLHRELDLSHHRRPEVPWLYLPKLVRSAGPRVFYLEQYLRMWRGPVPIASLPSGAEQKTTHTVCVSVPLEISK